MFDWDGEKLLKNLAKHRLDFVAVWMVFDGRPTITNDRSSYRSSLRDDGRDPRKILHDRLDLAEENRRIISFRRARDGEERGYLQPHG